MHQSVAVSSPVRPAGGSAAPRDALPAFTAWVVALGGALVAGALTSLGQGAGSVLASLANSAGPWFVVAAALVLVVRPPLWIALPLGVVCLELMHVGYWAATVLRGFPDTFSLLGFWELMGVPAGLLAGLVATWVRRRGWHRSVAVALVTSVLVGEGVRALLQTSATTGIAFWVIEIVAGVVATAVGMLAARSALDRVIVLATALVGTAGVLGAFVLLSGV